MNAPNAPRRTTAARPDPASRLPSWLTRERAFIGGSLLVAAVTVVIAVTLIANPPQDPRTVLIEGVETFPLQTATHVDTRVSYPQNPPAGGPHHPVWQDCGVYTEPVANEHAVHSLEHGAVWITYQPDLDPAQVGQLQDITRRSSHRLLSPYPGIDSPIIISSWGYQLRLQRADDPRLMQFIAKYEQGQTTPELGATCSGGERRTLAQIAAATG